MGPDLPQHPPGFPEVRTLRYVLSGNFLNAIYEIHNASQLTDDPICQVTSGGPSVLVTPGDAIPNDPPGPGGTFTDLARPLAGVNYFAWTGTGAGFAGTYTRRLSDGAKFRIVDQSGLDFGPQTGGTIAFQGDKLIISSGGTSASGGIYGAHPEGQTPAELILPHRTNYDPNDPAKQFRDGTVTDIDGDRAVIVGRAEGSVPAIFLWDIENGAMLEIARGGMSIPGGGTFAGFDKAAVSARGSQLAESVVAFTGLDQNFSPAGLFVYAAGQILPVTRPGDIVDGKEVQTVDFHPDAMVSVLAYAVGFNDGGSAARLACVLSLRTTRIVQTGGGTVVQGLGAANTTHKVLVTEDLNQPFRFLQNVDADSDGNWGFVDDYYGPQRFYKVVLANQLVPE